MSSYRVRSASRSDHRNLPSCRFVRRRVYPHRSGHRRENQRDLQRERVTPGVSWSRGSHGIGALGRTDGCMSEVYVSESGHARGAGSRGPGVRAVNSHFLWYQYVGVPASATSGAACEGCLGLKVRNQVRLRV
jgi:hypothetical protein